MAHRPLPSPSGPVGCPAGIYGKGRNAGFPSTGSVGRVCGKRNVRDVAPIGGESRDRHPAIGRKRRGCCDCRKRSVGAVRTGDDRSGRGLLCVGQTFRQRGYDRAKWIGPGARRPFSGTDARGGTHPACRCSGRLSPLRSPGAIDAFCRLSEDHGKLGLDAVLAPVIQYAEAGVPVAPRAALDWQTTTATSAGRARDYYLSMVSHRARGKCSATRDRPRSCAGSLTRAAPGSTRARWPKTWSRRCGPLAACIRWTIS
jgi:hypothetical protein